jgi:hypothetical protein
MCLWQAVHCMLLLLLLLLTVLLHTVQKTVSLSSS